MSVKSKARQIRRAKQQATASLDGATPHAPIKAMEKRAAGEIVGAFLNALTFGALEPAPQSRA